MLAGRLLAVFALAVTPAPTQFDPPPTAFFINLNLIHKIKCAGGSGSGSFIDDGLFLTAEHVIDSGGCSILGVPVEVKYSDEALDIAVVSVALKNPERIMLNCSGFVRGQVYYSVGYAFGTQFVVQKMEGTDNKRTLNIIGTNHKIENLRTLHGNMYKGMSGGPILDENGSMVGIVNTVDPNGVPIGGSRELKDTYLCQK